MLEMTANAGGVAGEDAVSREDQRAVGELGCAGHGR